jgi:hypothetical protein
MRYMTLLLLLGACASVPTQPPRTATLVVHVLSEDLLTPAAGVLVTLHGQDAQRTDARGNAQWRVKVPAEYTVVAEGAGWTYKMMGEVDRDVRWVAIAGR